MKKKTKKTLLSVAWQFIKLQLAGNILFWVTYLGYTLGDQLAHVPSWMSMGAASIFAHFLFFVVNKNWVFSTKTGKKKTREEIVRFITFMTLNYFINLGIVLGLEKYLHISPYVGQFIAGIFFAVWTWLGLKFWVFRHVRHAHHAAITIETRKTNAKRHAKYQRLEAKQKAKRAT
jgi:putative flippase GtrA